MTGIKGWCNSGLTAPYINDDVNKTGTCHRSIYWGRDWFYSKVLTGPATVRYPRISVYECWLTVLKGLYLYIELSPLCLLHRRQTNEILTRWVFTSKVASILMSSPYLTLLSVTIDWSILNFLTTLIPCLSSNHVNWYLEQDQILNICRLIRCDRTWSRNIDCIVIIQCACIPKQNNFLVDDEIGTLRGLYASLTRRGKNVVKRAARKYRKRNDFRD